MPSASVYEKLLESQQGGSIDRYIFHQSGNGIGNWFTKLARHIRPFLASSIKAIAPTALSIGSELVDRGTKNLISKIEKGERKVQENIKRRRDNLDITA